MVEKIYFCIALWAVCGMAGAADVTNLVIPAVSTNGIVSGVSSNPVPVDLRTEGETAAAPRSENDWKASLYGGFSASRGNTTQSAYRYGGQFEKKNGTEYNYKLEGDGRYTHNAVKTTVSKVELTGEMRRLLEDRWFISGRLAALHNDISEIAYQVKTGPGFGRYLADSDALRADVSTGFLYIRENESDEISNYVAWRLSQRLEWQVTQSVKLWTETEFLMSTVDLANYQLTCEAGLENKINHHMSLTVTVQNEYNNQTEDDVEKNDFEIDTGLKYSF
jgi:putative salt-induced outer membrane protein YdiY